MSHYARRHIHYRFLQQWAEAVAHDIIQAMAHFLDEKKEIWENGQQVEPD